MDTLLGTLLLGFSTGSVYALVALGFALIFQSAGVVDFARGPLITAASLVIFALEVNVGLIWPVALLITIAGVAAMGAVQYLVTVAPLGRSDRIAGSLVATLGFGIIISAVLVVLFGSGTRGVPALVSAAGFSVGNVPLDVDRVLAIPIAIALTALVWSVVQRTTVGQKLRAVAEDPEAAAMRGINVRGFDVGSFVAAGVLAAIAGIVVPAASAHAISIPTAPLLTIYGFVAIVVGGTGSTWGALVGGWLVGVSEALGTQLEPSAQHLFGLAVLVIVLLFRPQGVFSSPGLRRA